MNTRIKIILVVFGLVQIIWAALPQTHALPSQTAIKPEMEVERIVRERLKALQNGDVKTWKSHISMECVWTGPDLGLVNTKEVEQDLVAASSLPPRPPDEIQKFLVKVFGDVAIATYISIERRPDGKIVKQFRKTDTYAYRKKDWQLICAVESFVPPREVIKIDPLIYDQYSGTYELDAKVSVRIRREDKKLLMQWSDQKNPSELFPFAQDAFFEVDSQLADWVFIRGQDGKVNQFVFRMGGSELVSKKTK